jgi:hypothetical protein
MASSDTTVVITGVLRRRRNMSKKLVFFDIECVSNGVTEHHQQPTPPLPHSLTPTPNSLPIIQLVCEWNHIEIPKNIVAGIQIEAKGKWDERGRVSVFPNEIKVLNDTRQLQHSIWDNANILQSFRQIYQPIVSKDEWKKKSNEKKLEKLEKKRVATELYAATQLKLRMSSSSSVEVPNKTSSGDDINTEGHEHSSVTSGGLMEKSKHNLVFTQWLLDTFGVERLRAEGRGVCDIAGGRGLIALELVLRHDITATLVEPKPFRPNSSYRKRIKKWLKRRRNTDNTCSEVSTPITENESGLCDSSTKQQECDQDEWPIKIFQEEFHGLNDNATSEEVVRAVTESGILLAMHPDQATGAVLETALTLQKPFAVVPCCVFSRQFPHRLTPTGTTVSTYEELCDWIQAQGSGIERAILPFHGRNVVLYRL